MKFWKLCKSSLIRPKLFCRSIVSSSRPLRNAGSPFLIYRTKHINSQKEQSMSRIASPWFVFALALSFLSPIYTNAQNKSISGAVFVMTNAADKNEVLSYSRSADGSLQPAGTFATGGRGSGGGNDPLGSQGSLTLSQDRSLLFAVNAGSGEVSVFRVRGAELALTQHLPRSGSEPVAVGQHGSLVYVLNAGGTSGVVGFFLAHGRLTPIPNSLRFLSTGTSGAASLAFSRDRS